MCLYYMFHRKNMNELEKDPENYIEKLFSFLENEGFSKSHRQVNGDNCFSYVKNDFYIIIDYDCFMKMRYVNVSVYYKVWDKNPLIDHLFLEDERYKERFQRYDDLNCKDKIDLVAEYLSEHIEDVMNANITNCRY